MPEYTYICKIDCPDKTGILHAITKILYAQQCNIVSLNEYVDEEHRRFFVRIVYKSSENYSAEYLQKCKDTLYAVIQSGNIYISPPRKKNIVIFVSKTFHCLSEILTRHYFNTLNADISAVVSNHTELQDFCQRMDIPFIHVSTEGLSREEHEIQVLQKISSYKPEYIVLARYMRILTPHFVSQYPHRIINIHHSPLPAFIGANPYRQAYERGVKIIGATAHFVNDDLDKGPIITQKVLNMDHTFTAARMQDAGRDIEKLTLAEALDYVLNDKVFVFHNKTITF